MSINVQTAPISAEQAREENAYAVGLQAYLWGFPLHYYSRSSPKSVEVGGSFINDFRKYTELKTAKDRFVVTPNNVTIDAYATTDLTAEPVVIFVPALAESRWYIVQIGDSFDEIVRNIGGTKGAQSGIYIITGPDFRGDVPGEMTQIKSRTKIGLVAVRILANGASDLPKAVEAQTGFRLMPLSAYLRYGLAYKPPAERPQMALYDSKAPEDIRFFDELGYAMSRRLPASADSEDSLVASFRQIGLSIGNGFEWQTLDAATRRGLARAAKIGPQIVDSKWAATGETTNGWKYTFAGGRAGYDPGLRAALTKYEVGAQLSDQVIYPNTSVDDKGEQHRGPEIRASVRRRQTSAGFRILEHGNVRERYAVRRKRFRPLQLRQYNGQPEEEFRWLADHPHSERQTGGHVELASCAGGQFQPDHAFLWPADACARRFLSPASSEAHAMMTNHPLPSWNDGAAKSAILDFVAHVTNEGGPDFVPSAERIATFDNDGTLWCEQPLQVQFFFAHDRRKALLEKDPSLKDRQPFKAFIEQDMKTIHDLGKKGFFEVAAAEHAGMTEEEFDKVVSDWLATATHPKFGRLFKHCIYRPQVELLQYLRDNGFKTFIVSGGGIDLMRAFAEEAYGIAREHVIGSSVQTRFEIRDGRADLMKLAEINSFDDREVKPANIGLHIGRRPILAFGNSDGDLAMLRYTKSGKGARMALLIHHDDAEREVAYDREFKLSPLAEALDKAGEYGITVVSMKRDWKTVFDANA